MNAVAPTMLSSSNVPQPEFACWWPSSPSAASIAAYSPRLSPFMSRCCQSMLTLTLSSDRAPLRLLANLLVGRDEPASPEAGVEVEPRGDAVDPVAVERSAHLVEVLLGELLRVVELIVVDLLAEARHCAFHAVDRRLACVLGLVAARHEPGDHRPEGPDAETRLHAGTAARSSTA